MSKSYRAVKVPTDDTDGFDKTIKWALLMCSNVDGNNNKFYCLELMHNESTGQYRLFSHYGRLAGGTADGGVYDVRGPDTDLSSLEAEFATIVKDKEKGKSKTAADGSKYRENYVKVDVVQPTVGSPNIRKVSGAAATASVSKTNGNSGLAAMFSQFGPQESKVLTQLFNENIHNITTATTFKMTAHGLETPLGPLTLDHIGKAIAVLDDLKNFIPTDGSRADFTNRDFRDLNTRAYSLIPRPFARGYTIQDSDLIFDMSKLLAEYDLLDQMKSTVQITNDADDGKAPDLPIKMFMSDRDTTETLFHYLNSTRNHRQLDSWKPVRCYDVEGIAERARFMKMMERMEAAKQGAAGTIIGHKRPGGGKTIVSDYDVVDLFHGSPNRNVLSIMMNGFYVPPVNAPGVTGRMYGNGVYAANVSTKALNYALNNWSRSGLSNSGHRGNAFLFITKFTMGKIHCAPRALSSGTPRGFNSIYAPGGADLANDEFIVADPAQSTITHLIELEQR